MKLIISLILIGLAKPSFASMIHIYYESVENITLAKQVQERLTFKYQIPISLIKVSKRECQSTDSRFLEVCINEKRELIELPNLNKNKILKSFYVFKTKEIL